MSALTEDVEFTERIEFPSKAENIHLVEKLIDEVCARHNVHESHYGNILIALTEAVNNAIHHGNRLDPAKQVMVGHDTFGRVSLDSGVISVDDDMYMETSAILLENGATDGVDITNPKNIYVRVKISDDEGGSTDGTVLGRRDHEPTGNFAPLDFVFESLCDTYHIRLSDPDGEETADMMVTMKEFVDPELHESAENVLVGDDKTRFGKAGEADNQIVDKIFNVRKRMFRETKAINVSDKSDTTNRKNLYVVVETKDEDGNTARGVILGRRGGEDPNKFIGVQWAYTGGAEGLVQCMASGQ